MSQSKRILEYLEGGNKLSRLNAWNQLGVLEAPARISELRAKGYDIKTEMITVVNRFNEKVKIAEWSIS